MSPARWPRTAPGSNGRRYATSLQRGSSRCRCRCCWREASSGCCDTSRANQDSARHKGRFSSILQGHLPSRSGTGGQLPRRCANHKLWLEWNGMNTLAVLFALCTLTSCIAAPRTEFTRADGTMVYAISCDSINDCATEAAELCPAGHDIVPAASGGRGTTARAGIGVRPGPQTRLLIECKAPSP